MKKLLIIGFLINSLFCFSKEYEIKLSNNTSKIINIPEDNKSKDELILKISSLYLEERIYADKITNLFNDLSSDYSNLLLQFENTNNELKTVNLKLTEYEKTSNKNPVLKSNLVKPLIIGGFDWQPIINKYSGNIGIGVEILDLAIVTPFIRISNDSIMPISLGVNFGLCLPFNWFIKKK